MPPRKNNLIPDMKETRYKTESFANPYAPVTPKQTAFKTPNLVNVTPYGLTQSEYKAYNTPDSNPLVAFIEGGGGNFNARSRAIGKVSAYKQAQNQAEEDKKTVNLFGKTVKESDLWGLAATAALTGAGIYAARSGMRVRASTRSLARSQVANAETIAANRVAARVQGREFADTRQAARRERRSTNVRAIRLERAEAALKGSNPALAQAAGDRAYAFRAGNTIRTEMATSPTIGPGRRTLPSVGFGPRQVGARSFPNTDGPAAGSHHQYTPVSMSSPGGQVSYPGRGTRGSSDAHEWLIKTTGYSDSYGRTGMDRLVGMYSGGVPKGGWTRQPNLRKYTPVPSRWDRNLKDPVINPGEMADGPNRDRVVSLLDDATAFRNRSAWRLTGGTNDSRTAFPKAFSWINDPKWAPESYQLRVIKSAESRAQRSIPAPKKRIGKGK